MRHPRHIILISIFSMPLIFPASLSLAAEAEPQATRIPRMLREEISTLSPASALDPAKINYRIYGKKNKEIVILVHGLGGDLRTWDNVAEDLSEQNKVVTYGQRGHGRTPAPDHNFSSAIMATDLKNLMDHLGIARVSVVGHSMGGRTAVQFANLYPERPQSLIVEDIHMIGRSSLLPDKTGLSNAIAELSCKKFETVQDSVTFAEKKFGAMDENKAQWLGLFQDQKTGMWRYNGVRPPMPLYESQGLQEDLTKSLRSVKSPSLFLTADPDMNPVLFGKGVEHLNTHRPDAKVVVIQGAGHSIYHPQYDAYMDELRVFLQANRQPVKLNET